MTNNEKLQELGEAALQAVEAMEAKHARGPELREFIRRSNAYLDALGDAVGFPKPRPKRKTAPPPPRRRR